MKRETVAALSVAILMAGCASSGMPSMASFPGASAKAPAAPREAFSYGVAKDRDVRVTIDRVVLVGDREFLPSDPNWVQVHVVIENVGPRMVTVGSVKARLNDGQVLRSAAGWSDITKPPSFVKSNMMTAGVGATGMLAGSLLFPPAALLGGAYMAFKPMYDADRMQRGIARMTETSLRAEPVAPGTSTAGFVYVPAVAGQTGLIVFYDVDGKTQSLSVPRTGLATEASR